MTAPKPGEDQRDRSRSANNLPVPDPTVLTTQLVDRALAAYREVVETRLGAMDKAVNLLASDIVSAKKDMHDSTAHFMNDRDRQIHALREILTSSVERVSDVTTEKFTAVDTRFLERDTRTQQAADESRISLDAALAAAKEAVSEQNKANTEAIRKSELATQKQIDSLVALMNTANKSLEDKFSDIKSRLDRGEGQAHGVTDAHTERRLDMGQMLLSIAVVLSAIAIVVTIVLSRTGH